MVVPRCWVLCCVLLACTSAAQRFVVPLRRSSTETVLANVKTAREEANSPGADATSFLEMPAKPLSGFKKLEYVGPVSVGGKEFDMVFDTSTPNLWLPSTSCATCCNAGKRSSAPVVDANTAVAMYEQFPDGTWYSGVSQEADTSVGELTVFQLTYFQIFVRGHTVPQKSAQTEDCHDAVLGLGFSRRWSEPNAANHRRLSHRELDTLEKKQGIRLSFIDKIHQDHLVTEPVFSMYLTEGETGSEVELGGINRGRIDTELNPSGLFWVSAVGFPDYHWAFNVPRICINSQCAKTGNIPAKISSAAPYIALPQAIYDMLLSPQERMIDPCLLGRLLPSISFLTVGTEEADPSRRFTGQLELCAADYALTGTSDSQQPQCDFAIVPTRLPVIVLGTPFLRKYFTVFDVENKRMGFAQTSDKCSPQGQGGQRSESTETSGEPRPFFNPIALQPFQKTFVN